MKIINVIQRFNVGGIQKLLLEYLRFFKDNKEIDYRVVVLEKNEGSLYDKICEEEGLKIEYLNCYFSKNKHYHMRAFHRWWILNHSLTKYLKKQKPDVVHTHNTRMLYLIESCIKKTKSKYKWFHTLHSDPFAVNENHIPIAKRVFGKFGVKPICLNKSQFGKAKLRYGINDCYYLYNAFNQQKFLDFPVIRRNEFRTELGIPLDCFLIGCVGRIDPVKNYSFFIDVMFEVKKICNNSFAIIAGDGELDISLKNKIDKYELTNNLLFLGARKDVQNIYSSIDRFVMTSLYESSAFSLLEAQLFEKECIVSSNIPEESICLNNKVVRIDLTETPKYWAKQILSPSEFSSPISTLNDYSIQKLSCELIKIYKSK